MKDVTLKQNGALIIALSRSLQIIHKESEVLFRQNRLTMAQFTVLEALRHKGALTVGEIIEAVLSSSGNMTVVIRNLEQQGWVCRRENPADKRSYLICLTETGRTLIDTVFQQHMTLVEQALSPLTSEEKQTVITILKKLL